MSRPSVNELEALAREAAELAGRELLDRFGQSGDVLYTKAREVDVVGAADLASEQLLTDLLHARRPMDGILSEEGAARDGSSGLRWVIDPLDGTMNYLRGVPHWSVSVACESERGGLAAAVYDAIRDEMFTAAQGQPVMMNGRPCPEPRRREARDALIIATLEHADTAAPDRRAKLAAALYAHVAQIRTTGSAALDLAWTAVGRCDACYHEDWAMHWDIAAGELLCERAGLNVVRLGPAGPGLSNRVLAAASGMSAELLSVLDEAV